jgi:asparagine synthase (glutamine-hydrolysing)
MCGIVGYITNSGPVLDPFLITNMCDQIVHRGPDGFGHFLDGPVALGHRRLSIIDVAGGKQPIGNEDGKIQVVFNGEIYNYRELREQLLSRGHRITTQSDTEVLVHLYEDVGERLPEFLNGMFAFAIWDARKQQLFLARDRFGEKPLYYSCAVPGLRFCFASELKALRVIPQFPAAINARSVSDFLAVSYIPDPNTIYQNVYKLSPGHTLTVSPAGVQTRRYWQPRFEIDAGRNFDHAVEEIRELAEDSVERRMISEVPLGGFLSGGVDSSSVVAFMCRRAPGQVKTFSIGFSDKDFDETAFARLTASRYQTEHHEKIVTPDILEMLDMLTRHYDEPFADSSAVPCLYLARMTREFVTVALSGDGADELFGGYRRYFFAVFEERLRHLFPGWFRHSVIRAAGRWYPKLDYLPQVFRAKSTLLGVSQELADAYFTAVSGMSGGLVDKILAPDLQCALNGYSLQSRFRELFQSVSHLPPLQQVQAVDLETYLPGDILVKMDRATMAYSLEARAPMLDHRLAELACRLPEQFKLHGRNGKHILKQAVAPYVPASVIRRPKAGFAVPLASWFRTALKPVFENTVLQPDMREFIRLEDTRRIWNEHQSGFHNHDRKLWTLLMLGLWNARHRMQTENLSEAIVGQVSTI